MSKERSASSTIVITMIVIMKLGKKRVEQKRQCHQRASDVSAADNVSVLSGERCRVFTGSGTCRNPFLLFLLLRLRAAEFDDRKFDEPVADDEVRGICSEPFDDDDDDEAEVGGVSGVVVRLLHSKPGIKSCSSN
jgi:hypothetical protein